MTDLHDRMLAEQSRNRIAYATWRQFGDIPLDEKYMPIMVAFVECEKTEAVWRAMQKLLEETLSGKEDTLVEAVKKATADFRAATIKFKDLTDAYREEH